MIAIARQIASAGSTMIAIPRSMAWSDSGDMIIVHYPFV
jgi:hypothetical protein